MIRDQKILQLKESIQTTLGGLIDRDYVFAGVPYYLNIGDILLWEGTRRYLKTLPYRCLNAGYHYREGGRITPDTMILFQGGGNFGDLWRFLQDERLDILRRYPSNRALIFPVSCWYDDPVSLCRDAKEMAGYPNLTICVRDQSSYEMLVRHFRNQILLVPDMAFFMNPLPLRKYNKSRPQGLLYLKRNDKESVHGKTSPMEPPDGITVTDWPSMVRDPWHWELYKNVLKWGYCARSKRVLWRLSNALVGGSDCFYHHVCRPLYIRQGAEFIGRFREIQTTRLHGAILAILMNRDVRIEDNLDGKISAFYRTWLRDVEGVNLVG